MSDDISDISEMWKWFQSHPGMVYLNICVFWHFSLLYILWRF